jgi:hypothetical protein
MSRPLDIGLSLLSSLLQVSPRGFYRALIDTLRARIGAPRR